ncbi:hypothetical protein CR513_00143, partial [Mucuna pruriens]
MAKLWDEGKMNDVISIKHLAVHQKNTQIQRIIQEGYLRRFVKTNEKERLTVGELLERDSSRTPRRRP